MQLVSKGLRLRAESRKTPGCYRSKRWMSCNIRPYLSCMICQLLFSCNTQVDNVDIDRYNTAAFKDMPHMAVVVKHNQHGLAISKTGATSQ